MRTKRSYCRCGAPASTCCGKCGNEVMTRQSPGTPECQLHPGTEPKVITCVDCKQPLCFWHYVIQPVPGVVVDARGARDAVRQAHRCFPGCRHALDGHEWRPEAA